MTASTVRVSTDRFEAAQPLDEFVASARKNKDFWLAAYRTARLPEPARQRAEQLKHSWRLLVLVEDWCADAVSTLPLMHRLAEASPQLELRVLSRDANPDLMDTHLTQGNRSIPVVMILDSEGREHGWWGPRPAPLQEWYYSTGRSLEPAERNLKKREWYARDRGQTMLDELLTVLEGADRLVEGGSSAGMSGR